MGSGFSREAPEEPSSGRLPPFRPGEVGTEVPDDREKRTGGHMHRSDPDQETGVQSHAKRLAVLQRLLDDLSRRETLALGASIPLDHGFRWASLGPEAGLTENQEDFVDYWAPQPVLAECRAQRDLRPGRVGTHHRVASERDAAPAAGWASRRRHHPPPGADPRTVHAQRSDSCELYPVRGTAVGGADLCTVEMPHVGARTPGLGKSADAESTRPTTE